MQAIKTTLAIMFALITVPTSIGGCTDDDADPTTEAVALPQTEADCNAAGYEWVEDESAYYGPGGPTPGPTETFCVIPCSSDAACTTADRPFCREHGLFDGGDWGCNTTMSVCRAEDRDDCDG